MRIKENIIKFSMFLRAGAVESGPPLSTILGNYGVNTANFCREVNELTKDLPNFLLLEVIITINSDRTFFFLINEPSVSFLLKIVSTKHGILVKGQGGFKTNYIKIVKLHDIYLISKFRYGLYNKRTLKTICGTLSSLNYYII